MKPSQFGMSLILLASLAACGDASAPDDTNARKIDPPTSALPNPADVLAALPPAEQPYGLDVYTARCMSCHGDLGDGAGNNPALKGLKRAVVQQKLLDYRSDSKQTAVAAHTLLSDAEVAAVSIYIGE
jgi:mono/diheme cytochrome c family protein